MSAKIISKLNDELRRYIFNAHNKDKIVLSENVSTLPYKDKLEVLKKVKDFDNFTEDNNPYKENDFGAFDYKAIKFFWKIDYYDNDLHYHSEDNTNTEKTIRVLTVMKASEY